MHGYRKIMLSRGFSFWLTKGDHTYCDKLTIIWIQRKSLFYQYGVHFNNI